MLTLIATTATIIIGIFCALATWIFLRALSAKMMTGKWPHQSQEAKDIFDMLP